MRNTVDDYLQRQIAQKILNWKSKRIQSLDGANEIISYKANNTEITNLWYHTYIYGIIHESTWYKLWYHMLHIIYDFTYFVSVLWFHIQILWQQLCIRAITPIVISQAMISHCSILNCDSGIGILYDIIQPNVPDVERFDSSQSYKSSWLGIWHGQAGDLRPGPGPPHR